MNTIIKISEFIFAISLFINAALFVPQILILLRKKNSQGVSLITFFGFCFTQFFTIIHGYIHRDYILMVGYILSILTCGIATGLIIYYKKKPIRV